MNKFLKYIYFLSGTFFLILGIIGAFLPVLPTTPLVMLACFFYAKSSTTFHNKLVNSNFYKKYAKEFVENKTLSLKRKIFLLSFASTMLLFPLFILNGIVKLFIVFMYIYLYYYFFFKIKTK